MELEDINLYIKTETLTLTKANLVTGEIYFTIQSGATFPEKGWRDFVVVILTWWHDALHKLIESKQNKMEEEFDFMDGPLLVRVVKVSNDGLVLNFIKEMRDTEQIIFTANASMTKLKSTLLKASKELLGELNQRNWHSDDIEELKRKHDLLSNS